MLSVTGLFGSGGTCADANGTAPIPAIANAAIPAFSATRRVHFVHLSIVLMCFLLFCVKVRHTARRLYRRLPPRSIDSLLRPHRHFISQFGTAIEIAGT